MPGLVVVVVMAIQLACLTPEAGAVGVGVHLGGASTAPEVLSAINETHPGWVNIFMGWNGIELAKGVYNEPMLAVYEREFAALPPGTRINVNVAGTPAWATAGGSTDTRQPPADTQDYADFLRYVAARFAGRVTSWEIWNEEDSTDWWQGGLPTYVQMLKQAYPAVKAGDPHAQVVLGGLVGNDYQFLEQAYADGAGGAFDVVGVHTDTGCNTRSPYFFQRDPDGRIDRFSFLGYREVHATMVQHGDGDKPIYMSELGWSTTAARCPTADKPGGIDPAEQATFLTQAYHCLAGDPYVAVGIWFELVDNSTADTPVNRFGLLSTDFARKPAFDAFKSLARDGDQLTGTCGNFTPPQITISSPTQRQSDPGPLRIAVSATSPAGVTRLSLYHDGNSPIRNFADAAAPTTLSGAIDWQGAKRLGPGIHTLVVKAIDPQGNISTQTVTFSHGSGRATKGRREAGARGTGGRAGRRTNGPLLGKSVSAAVVHGRVSVLLPATSHFARVGGDRAGYVALTHTRMLPVGSILDATAGIVRLKVTVDHRGRLRSGDFGGGVFRILRNGRGVVVVRDLRRHRRIVPHAGRTRLARAP